MTAILAVILQVLNPTTGRVRQVFHDNVWMILGCTFIVQFQLCAFASLLAYDQVADVDGLSIVFIEAEFLHMVFRRFTILRHRTIISAKKWHIIVAFLLRDLPRLDL